jgi:hypothetical protein
MFIVKITPATREFCEDVTGGVVPAHHKDQFLVVERNDTRVITPAEFEEMAERLDLIPNDITVW